MWKSVCLLQLQTYAGGGGASLSSSPLVSDPWIRLDYTLSVTVLYIFIATVFWEAELGKLLSQFFFRPSTDP